MPVPAPRASAFGLDHAVVTGHHLASQSALRILQAGGTLIDATIAASAVMTVALPHATSLGGCGMMLYHEAASGTTHALNGSGRSPALAALPAFAGRAIGPRGPATWVTPGLVGLWGQAHRRFGRVPWSALFDDAVTYARNGIGVSSEIDRNLRLAKPAVTRQPGFGPLFMPGGRPLRAGQRLRQPALAETLRLIAENGPGIFHTGLVARQLAAFAEQEGGLLRADDLAAQDADWVRPVSQATCAGEVRVMPPNSLGVLMLAQLDALAPFADAGPADRAEAQIRIARACLERYQRRVADPAASWPVPAGHELGMAGDPAPSAGRGGRPRDPGDTAGIVLADRHGNTVSMLQSVFQPFGSGCVDPASGILLNNRLIEFDLDPASPNALAPRKRPLHTLNPYVITRDGKAVLAGASPGGVSQTTTGVQVITRACIDHLPLTLAIDTARWSISRDGDILLEPGFEPGVAQRLRQRHIPVEEDSRHEFYFGSAKLIRIHADGRLEAAADLRRQACALAQ